jgi:ribosome-binding factor A
MSIRQKKIEAVLQKELSTILRENAREYCLGAMVTVTGIRVAPDLSFAKAFLSVFGGKDNDAAFAHVDNSKGEIRFQLGKRLGKSMRRIPELAFEIDDSLDYAEKIDKLLDDD